MRAPTVFATVGAAVSRQIRRAASGKKARRTPPLLRRIDGNKKDGWTFTVAGIVHAPPEDVLSFFSDPAAWPEVYSALEGVEVVGTNPEGELEYVSRSEVTVMGKSSVSAMRVLLDPEPERPTTGSTQGGGRIHFHQPQAQGMVKQLEGVNVVLPLESGGSGSLDDPQRLAIKLTQVTEDLLKEQGVIKEGAPARRLSWRRSSKKAAAADGSAQAPVKPHKSLKGFALNLWASMDQAAAAKGTGGASVVVMTQRIKLKMVPPGPLKSLITGPILAASARNLQDLCLHHNGIAPASSASFKQAAAAAASAAPAQAPAT